MFEAVRKNKRIAQVILVIIIIPFAFFGMDAYFTDAPGAAEVASVGKFRISAAELDRAVREQQDRLREAMGDQIDRAMLESEALRRSVIENLVNQRLLAMHAADNRMVVTQQQLQDVIAAVPGFQDQGRFSLERYETLLRAQGMTPAMFEARLGQDLRVQQVAQAVGESAFVASASARRFMAAQLEEREVREMKFSPSDLIAEVKFEDGAAERYYEANAARFERPARLRAEYVVFDEEAVLKKVSVSDEEAQKFYDGNPDRFGQPEERRARHILITVAADAPGDEVAKAREQAAGILAQLRSEPGRFEELAKARSQDPGSAEQGGDLGFFARGAMVKSFEDAVFTQEKGEVSELVRSDFGFHIIEVTDIKPSSVRPFAEVKEDVLDELRRQAAGRLFAEHAEQFANTVYEQADSLQPVADALGLEIRQTDWITRDDATIGSFRNEKLINALFSDEAIKQRRNVEAVEVERGTLVAARVLEFEAAQRLPFDEVRSAVEDQLRREEAARLAVARGEAALASLNRGEEATGDWNAALRVQRGNPTLPPAAMEAVFGASAAKLPTYVGIASEDDGYSVFRIDAVTRPVLTSDDPRLKSVAEQYERLIAERDFNAFLAALREHYKVEINTAALRAPQQ